LGNRGLSPRYRDFSSQAISPRGIIKVGGAQQLLDILKGRGAELAQEALQDIVDENLLEID